MDSVELVVGILRDELTVPVHTEIPQDRAGQLVLVSLEGDQSTEYLLLPRISLTCWGSSDRDAHGIALSAYEVLRDAALDHPYLSAADLVTLSREEWSRNGQSRYIAIIDLTINTDE